MPKENCTVTVTEFAIYPPPFMTFSTPAKKSFRMRFNRFIDELKHFDLKAVKENLLFNPVGKKTEVAKSQKDLRSQSQKALAIYSVIDSAQKDVEEIKNIMIRRFER